MTTIPTFSIADFLAADDPVPAAQALCRACHDIGFLYVVDHGVPADFVEHYFGLLEQFFALPDAVKAGIDKRRSPHFRGWEAVGAELTNNRVDHREQLDLCTEHPPYGPEAEPPYLRLDGPNPWLPDEVLPGFRAAVEQFFAETGRVAWTLMEAMSLGLGLDRHHLRNLFGERPFSLVKLIHYPTTPPGEAGVNAHHDAGFLTLLWQHGVSGLQVENQDGDWIDVPVDDGAIVVNLGEMLQSMTGNYFVATNHRVIATEERFSSAYFHGPGLTTSLAPLPLDDRFADAVEASPRHRSAGFMAKRDELLAGAAGTISTSADTYGQQLWNYFTRSYPELVRRHHPALVGSE